MWTRYWRGGVRKVAVVTLLGAWVLLMPPKLRDFPLGRSFATEGACQSFKGDLQRARVRVEKDSQSTTTAADSPVYARGIDELLRTVGRAERPTSGPLSKNDRFTFLATVRFIRDVSRGECLPEARAAMRKR